jgi:glycosyltransferase involved in cell wall biosynthesis
VNRKSQSLVHVVTPVYNCAEYLAECIESVLSQTYQNWEYTIVDNCSTDGSLEIARRYAAKDPRIRVHENQQFLKAVQNHNHALRQISPESKYCKVVFADDWIFPECLEKMVEVAEEHPSIAIVGAYGLKDGEVMWAGLPYPSHFISGRDVCRRLFLDRLYVFGSATSLLYRSSIVRDRDPFFNESNIHADMETCVSIMRNADFGFVHQILTFSRVREGSLETVSSDFNSLAPGKLHDLVNYGHDFLTEKEYAACLNRSVSLYYESLVGGMLRGLNSKYWNFHKQKLAEAGIHFSKARLLKVALAKSCVALLNPKATIEKGLKIARETIRRRRTAMASIETK